MSQSKWKKETLVELVKDSGLKYHTVYQRVKVWNWDLNTALTTSLTTPKSYKKILKKLNK